MAAFATVFWAAVILSIFGIFYGLTFLVFSLVARALFLANLRGNGLLVSERQLPHIHAAVIKAAHRLGLETPPTAYVMQSEGSLNAFATKLISRNYIVIYSALIDACADQAQVDFVVAHEVGHLAAGHLKWMGFLAPARLLPWLGPAYSRACEYTCDRCGLAVVQDAAAADRGLLVLAAGSKASMQADVEYFMAQRLETGGFWSALVELGSSHPYLCKRVAALRDYEQPGSMAPVARNPLAYVFAPFASAGGVAGAGGGLLVMVAMMGIIAAIAIPSLLRARVAVNEATAIGDARDVIRAQASFKNMTGGYGSIECLAAPASCITGYPATGPVLLTAIQAAPQANGYERAIVHSDTDSFVYLSAPLSPSTGIRTFCADARGVVCSAPSAAEASAGTTCSRLCQPLR
jgi:Zn-dependent protease with chaperone function/type II secretory pathway pseudopilin PulG